MKQSIKYEAIKNALIVALKKHIPEDGCKCKLCNAPIKHIHIVDIRGIGTFHFCGQCMEEMKDYFLRRELSAYDHMFEPMAIRDFRRRTSEYEEDFDSGSYYDVATYQNDHL